MPSVRGNITFIVWIRSVCLKKDKRRNFNSARGDVFGGVTEARSWLRTDCFIRGYSLIVFTD